MNTLSVGGGAAGAQCFKPHPGLPQGRSQVFCQVLRPEHSIFRSYGHRIGYGNTVFGTYFIPNEGYYIIRHKQQHLGIYVPILKESSVGESTPSFFFITGEPKELFFLLILPQVTGLDTADALQWRFP